MATADQAPSRVTQRHVLIITSVASLLVGLDALVVSTAVTTIRQDLGASPEQLQWMVNSYTLTFAVLLMPASALGERIGRRRAFMAGLLVFGGASVACALAGNPSVLIAARAVQGAGSALIMPLALALLTSAFPPAERAGALGVFAATTGLSVPLGPLVGGAVVHGISWPWIFWLNVPLAVGLAAAVRLRLEKTEPSPARLDIPGTLLIGIGALGIVWGLVRGNTSGWTSIEILASLGAGAVAIALFVWWESRAAAPMLSPDLFARPQFSAGVVAAFFLTASTIGSIYFMAQFFQSGQGLGALAAGGRMIAWGTTTVFVPRLVAKRIPAHAEGIFIVGGMLLHAGSLLAFAALATPDRTYLALVLPLVLSGTGVAMAIPAAQSLTLSSVSGPKLGAAAGAFSMLRQLGAAAGVAAMVAAFATDGSFASAASFTAGFTRSLLVGAVLALVAGSAGLIGLKRGRPPETTAGTTEAQVDPRAGRQPSNILRRTEDVPRP
jgi:EmrB/QacA subfamily drug resistance transporter